MTLKAIFCCLSILVSTLLSPVCNAVDYTLSVDPDKWRQVTFPESNLNGSDCLFSIQDDPAAGKVFSVGPWSSGKWSARYLYLPGIPMKKCLVSGYYRTTGLLPFQAAATITFFRADKPLAKKKYDFAPSLSWKKFRLAVKNSPGGTEYLTIAIGLEEKTAGRLEFSRMKISEFTETASSKKFIPSVKIKPISLYKSDSVYGIEKYLDNYWLVDPGGKALYASGIGGFNSKMNDDQFSRVAERVIKCRFNCLIATADDLENILKINDKIQSFNEPPCMVFYTIRTNSLKGFRYLENSTGSTGITGHAFPDPYDPAFEKAYKNEVERISTLLGDKKWFAGWFADNELSHADLYNFIYSDDCSAAFRNFLEEKYTEVDALNRSWNKEYSSFDGAIMDKSPLMQKAGGRYQDFIMFERKTVQEYIDITVNAVKTFDQDRLILSNRFMCRDISAYARILDLYSAYDAMALNLYPSNNEPGLSHNEKAFLRMFHDLTGRPVFISEWSLPAMDSGLYDSLPLDWSWAQAVETQQERADQLYQIIMGLYNMPFVVGAGWYSWRDINTDQRKANRGIVTDSNVDYNILQSQIRKSNMYIAR